MRTIIPKGAKLIPKNAKCVFRGQIFDIYQWPQKMFDGSFETFEMAKRADTVTIFAIKDGKIVILKQRQPNTSEFYGVPGGRHDHEGETELDAAKRECLEETGMTFRNWKLIYVQQPQGKLDWFNYTFLATDFIKQVPQQLDNGEKISIKLMTLDQVNEIVENPDINSRSDFPRAIFDHVKTIDDLINWPEYQVD